MGAKVFCSEGEYELELGTLAVTYCDDDNMESYAGVHPCPGPTSLRCLSSKGPGLAAAPGASASLHQEAYAGKPYAAI